MNCTDKFLKHSERVGARFAEQNAGAYPHVFSRRLACENRELSVFFVLMSSLILALRRRGYGCRQQIGADRPRLGRPYLSYNVVVIHSNTLHVSHRIASLPRSLLCILAIRTHCSQTDV